MTDLLTKAEAAEHLRSCVRTIDRLVAKGVLPAVKFGRKTLIKQGDLEAFIEESTVECRTNEKVRRTGGSKSAVAAKLLDDQLERLIGRRRKSSKPSGADPRKGTSSTRSLPST